MSATHRSEEQMKDDIGRQLRVTDDPLQRLRLLCLQRGCAGIKSLARFTLTVVKPKKRLTEAFRVVDDDGNRRLDLAEFEKGVRDFGAEMSRQQVQQIFDSLDTDRSGNIDFDEFLIALRPPMSISRQNIVNEAFKKLDRTGDGVVRVDDLELFYKVDRHPKYISGECSKEQLLKQFLNTFQVNQTDDEVTRDDFLNYYAGVSASIDSDIYFDLMMRTAWKL